MISPELHESAIKKGIIILQTMSFVHHQRRPRHAPQEVLVLEQDLVSGDQNIKLELPVGMTPLVLAYLREQQKKVSLKNVSFCF